MVPMASYWNRVLSDGLTVPSDRPLDELTAELTTMLGSPDPALRDGTAYPALATWLERGVYDNLLAGLGDGMTAGLKVGLGERDTDTVFRRSFSALVLAECIERDNTIFRLPGGKLLDWGDRVATWYLREADVRGFVPTKGWAHSVAHGADVLGALGGSFHFGAPELTVLLDVLGERAVLPVGHVFTSGEPDRMAQAAMRILRRNLISLSVLEPWVARIAGAATATAPGDGDPFVRTGNAEAFLRALHLQLSLGGNWPAVRSDLLLVLIDALKATNPRYLRTSS